MNHTAALQPPAPLVHGPKPTLPTAQVPATATAQKHAPPVAPGHQPRDRQTYLAVLTWAFTVFNTLRAVAYLPTMWAIYSSGDSSQHSLWTWCTWLGANATMAAWLYEQNGQRLGRAVVVNIGNAAMCAVTLALILAHRGLPF